MEFSGSLLKMSSNILIVLTFAKSVLVGMKSELVEFCHLYHQNNIKVSVELCLSSG